MVKDFKSRNREEILLPGVKTVEEMLAEGVDPAPNLKHVCFIREKALKKKVSILRQYVLGYDEAVRDRAKFEGLYV